MAPNSYVFRERTEIEPVIRDSDPPLPDPANTMADVWLRVVEWKWPAGSFLRVSANFQSNLQGEGSRSTKKLKI